MTIPKLKKIVKNPALLYQLKYRPLDILSPFLCGAFRSGKCQRLKFHTAKELVDSHFEDLKDHPCKASLELALVTGGGEELNIIETGSSAHGTNSTVLFDGYVNSFGGKLVSVDIRASPMFKLRKICTSKTTLHCGDSITFLRKYSGYTPSQRKLFYLDSWDVNWSAPLPAMLHGLNEFLSILPALRPGDLVLIDDTPASSSILSTVADRERAQAYETLAALGLIGGKGSLIKDWIQAHGRFKILFHGYQLLIQAI